MKLLSKLDNYGKHVYTFGDLKKVIIYLDIELLMIKLKLKR